MEGNIRFQVEISDDGDTNLSFLGSRTPSHLSREPPPNTHTVSTLGSRILSHLWFFGTQLNDSP
jgi:hypothetical protein